jgi:hypothetical protein
MITRSVWPVRYHIERNNPKKLVKQECDNIFLTEQISFSLILKEKIFADRNLDRTKDVSRRNREDRQPQRPGTTGTLRQLEKPSQKVKQSFILSLSKDLNFKSRQFIRLIFSVVY